MGMFGTKTSRSNNNKSADSVLLELLKAKITQLEGQVEQKDSLIGSLQKGLHGNLHCLNKLDYNFTGSSSNLTMETMSESCASQVTDSTGTHSRSHEDHPLVTRLTSQLEDKNGEIATLQMQLEEQRLLSSTLQERLHMSEQGKATLVSHLGSLEKKIFDQANQIECLQDLNETNSSIVSEMELVNNNLTNQSHHRRASSGSSLNGSHSNQWKMYQKLESLMDTNNKVSQQLQNVTVEKQECLKMNSKLQTENLNLNDQVDALTKELEEANYKLVQMQFETDCDFSNHDESSRSLSVLPEIQQVLDIFPANSTSNRHDESENSSDNAVIHDDPKLLQLSLQVCQAQLQQIKRDHESALQKTVLQSVQLADSRAQVDTLTEKVDHYETLMDQVIAKSPALCPGHSASSNSSSSHGGANTGGGNTSKAARQVMAESGDILEFAGVSSYFKQPSNSSRMTISGAGSSLGLGKRLNFPKWGRGRANSKDVNINIAPTATATTKSESLERSSSASTATDC